LDKPEQSEDELLKSLKKIEKKISKIDRESKVGLEDQLFFGLVVALALFVVTINPIDFTTFLQSSFNFDYTTAANIANSIKNLSIGCLVLSSLTRYYGAVKPHKGARLWSIELLIVAFYFFLQQLLPSITLNFVFKVEAIAFPLSHILLFFIYFLLGDFFEIRIIKFYAERKLVYKKYAKPIVSFFFVLFSASLYFTIITQLISAVVFSSPLSQTSMSIIFVISYCVFVGFGWLLYLNKHRIIRLRSLEKS